MTARRATDALTRALLAIARQGLRPNCSDPGTSWLWLSEDPADRREAAKLCAGCPVYEPCGTAAEVRDERFGTWSGVDRTITAGRAKKAREAAA